MPQTPLPVDALRLSSRSTFQFRNRRCQITLPFQCIGEQGTVFAVSRRTLNTSARIHNSLFPIGSTGAYTTEQSVDMGNSAV
jgi:hypothetical protein